MDWGAEECRDTVPRYACLLISGGGKLWVEAVGEDGAVYPPATLAIREHLETMTKPLPFPQCSPCAI